jgi:membrane-bound lytic murein transglycosylase B
MALPSRRGSAALGGLLALLTAAPVLAIDTGRSDVAAFIDEVVARDHFKRSWVERLLAAAESKPAIIEAMSRPAEKVRPWFEYRRIFITDKRIRDGREFYHEHRTLLEDVAKRTAVPAPLIVAILGVETAYGRIVGGYRVLDALVTLSFDYPPRAPFFRGELEQLMLLARESGIDPLTAMGSYGGAMGAPQFMPRSVRRWAVDADGDGRIDLWNDWADIFASIANFLVAHGWQSGGPLVARAELADPDVEGLENGLEINATVGSLAERGVTLEQPMPAATPVLFLALREADGPTYRVGFHNFAVLMRYNHSALYALAICELTETIAAADAPP